MTTVAVPYGRETMPRCGCSEDPYVEIAADVIQNALRELRNKWVAGQPIYQQSQPAQEALAFLVFGIDGPEPFLYHELVGIESVAEMDPRTRISLFLRAAKVERSLQ